MHDRAGLILDQSKQRDRSGEGDLFARPTLHLSAEPMLGVNFWSRTGGPFMWRDYDDATVRSELRALKDSGFTLTRSFMFWPDFHPSPEVIDEGKVADFLRFLDACEELGLPTIPTFLVGHMSGEDWDVPWRRGRDLYSDRYMLNRQAFFIREMVTRLGEHPALRGWLITNEFTNYAGSSDSRDVRAWALICTDAVRQGGSDLPVSLGDGAWTMENTGRDNGFRLGEQRDIVDFTGPHSYPMDNDQVRVHFAAALSCETSHYGKPVILEEFGVSSAFSSDANAAAFYRQSLHNSLLAGATGWLAWNNTDFDLTGTPPYSHHPFELGFGLFRADGTPKPQLRELTRFREILDAVDFSRCRRADTRVAILMSSYTHMHPRIPDEERLCIPAITGHAYIAAKAADLSPGIVRELEDPRSPHLVIVPSNKLLTAPTVERLESRAEAGGHVYYAWFSGVSGLHRGAWWPDVNAVVGLPHTLRYGMQEVIDDVVTWTFTEPLGTLGIGDTLHFPVAGSIDARSMLPLDDSAIPADITVLARDAQGRPALVRRRVGSGAVYVSTYPIEYFGSVRPDANADDDVRTLYSALACEAGVRPPISIRHPRVYADTLIDENGHEFVWIVNLDAQPVDVEYELSAGGHLVDVLSRDRLDGRARLESFGVTVCEHIRPRSA